ncbi:unnamed protein product [Closterium sp. Yama58-4]|nr:unnamed protein product [Closterium sp. Yama58-4]
MGRGPPGGPGGPFGGPLPPVLIPVPGAGPLGPFLPAPPDVAARILRDPSFRPPPSLFDGFDGPPPPPPFDGPPLDLPPDAPLPPASGPAGPAPGGEEGRSPPPPSGAGGGARGEAARGRGGAGGRDGGGGRARGGREGPYGSPGRFGGMGMGMRSMGMGMGGMGMGMGMGPMGMMPMMGGPPHDPRGMRSYRDLDAPDDESTSLYIVRLRSALPLAAYRGGITSFPGWVDDDDDESAGPSGLRATVATIAHEAATLAGRIPRRARLTMENPQLKAYAQMLESQQMQIASDVGVTSDRIVYKYVGVTPLTIDSPTFLAMRAPGSLWPANGGQASAGEGMVVGVVDSGVWPEHPSFTHAGFPSSRPAGWSGKCDTTSEFKCNNKVIGARGFYKGFKEDTGGPDLSKDWLSPRDSFGHGTWCAGYVVCRVRGVQGTCCAGYVRGVQGMCVVCRVCAWCAGYVRGVQGMCVVCRVCAWCAGYVRGVQGMCVVCRACAWCAGHVRGVQGMCVVCRVCAWCAGYVRGVQGMCVVCRVCAWCAGHVRGVQGMCVVCRACAWSFKWGAFFGVQADVEAAVNQAVADGVDVLSLSLGGVDATQTYFSHMPYLAANLAGVLVAFAAGNGGAPGYDPSDAARSNASSASATPAATAYPAVADFSATGPLRDPSTNATATLPTNSILKPDIVGPGVDLYAAWPAEKVGKPGSYAQLSGTSMSAPHLAGIAALIMQKHPSWSPAQVMSAIMTTATTTDTSGAAIDNGYGEAATPWEMGSGHVFPSKVLNPGLTYDAQAAAYRNFLAGQSMKQAQKHFPGARLTAIAPRDLNRPSISVSQLKGTATTNRTVTNVADSSSTYTAIIKPPSGVSVTVSPNKFTIAPGKRVTFMVTFKVINTFESFQFGSVTLVDGNGHSVRTVLAVQPIRK